MIMCRQIGYIYPVVRIEWYKRVFTIWSAMPISQTFGTKTAMEIPFLYQHIEEMIMFMQRLMDLMNGGYIIIAEKAGFLSIVKPIQKSMSLGSLSFLRRLWTRTKSFWRTDQINGCGCETGNNPGLVIADIFELQRHAGDFVTKVVVIMDYNVMNNKHKRECHGTYWKQTPENKRVHYLLTHQQVCKRITLVNTSKYYSYKHWYSYEDEDPHGICFV